MKLSSGALALTAALFVPAVARADEAQAPQPAQDSSVPQGAPSGPTATGVPAGYHVEKQTRRGLVIVGASVFGGTYFTTVLFAATASVALHGTMDQLAPFFVPIVGPFMSISSMDPASNQILWAADGVAQVAGLTMAIVGLTVPRTVLVRNPSGTAEVSVSPLISARSLGIGGTF
jgi:hypothetical protein